MNPLSKTFIQTMNRFGSEKVPFVFFIDFDQQETVLIPADEADKKGIFFDFNGRTNAPEKEVSKNSIQLKKYPISFAEYQEQFSNVMRHIRLGNTYLVNFTAPTRIEIDLSLEDIFHRSKAKYKLLLKDTFTVFSPESFVVIRNGKISSFPMKGTIDATIENAEERIMRSEKELQEHTTIVDLIRNDLNIVAKRVRVTRFRYIERIRTHEKELLQVSSEICGILPSDYRSKLGEILAALLPAGSVTGAPKKRTVEIIKETERYDRGYYTGVMGYFDGESLDSAVMIRFIEKVGNEFYYKSGGGITYLSNAEAEYREMVEKVYVPIV